MAVDLLSSSGINSLINSYIKTEQRKRLSFLEERKTNYADKSSGYSTLLSKLNSFKSVVKDFTETGSNSIFSLRKAESSDSSIISATAGNSAAAGNYQFSVQQLAKNDLLISKDYAKSDIFALTGSHSFNINGGDGEGGEFTANINVEFGADETNESAMQKIANAINSDKAEINSAAKLKTDTFTGTGYFTIDVNGTEKTIDYDYSGVDYDTVFTDIADKISSISGVSAEKAIDGDNVSLKILATSSSDYLTIDQSKDSGGILASGALNINAIKEKGAAGFLSASSFSPEEGLSQVSISSKATGAGNRITSLSDSSGGQVLNFLGVNFGTTRPGYVQDAATDTPGFLYSDISSSSSKLNAKFSFNGINMVRDSNTISDVITDVTFNLHSVSETGSNSTTVNVENAKEKIKEEVESFIKSFNDVYSYLKKNSSVDSGKKGIFFADGNASSLLGAFKLTAYSNIEGIDSKELDRLSEIGISFDVQTGLSLSDSELFEQKLSEDIDSVERMFNSDNGIANSLLDTIEPFIGSGGYLTSSKEVLDSNLKNLTDKISSTKDSIDSSAEIMRKKYEDLQMQLASLLSMQDYFGSFFSGY